MSRRSPLSLLPVLSLSLTSALAAIGPITNLTISNADVAPDGYSRAAIVMNGQYPGPLITGNKGDKFKVNVINELTDKTMLKSTTVHFHGVNQQDTNWADGPAFVNQCPIVSGDSFVYEFSCAVQAGTFWYHSHLSTQYIDGLRGPMVIYDPNDPQAYLYDVDDESTVITLSDWYHTAAPLIAFPTSTDAVLINGLGRYVGGGSTPLAVINVTQGKRYRFRMICMSGDPYFTFSIDNHDMTIIEVDGINHLPLPVDQLDIFPGQRYSFVLIADQEVDNYWIRALPSRGASSFEGGINSAILRYEGAPEAEPTTSQTNSAAPLDETALMPLDMLPAPGDPFPGGVDYALNLYITLNGSSFYVNNQTWVNPTVPVLLQLMSGASNASDLLPSGSIYTLPPNATVELSFPMTDNRGAPHPMHLHGHSFSVIRSAGSDTYNYINPPRRDVVNTGTKGDNVTIRFRTDNPGPWFFHCHIDPHAGAGLAVVFVEDQPAISGFKTTEAWDNLCPTYDTLSSDDQ